MNQKEHILNLVHEALGELALDRIRLSNSIRKAIRIARLLSDYENLWWLELEMLNIKAHNAMKEMHKEIVSHIPKERQGVLFDKYWDSLKEERRYQDLKRTGTNVRLFDKDLGLSVGEIENRIEYFEREAEQITSALYQVEYRYYATEFKVILERIRRRVHYYLSSSEKELIYGQIQSDIFERNRRYVDSKLGKICPDVLEKFVAVYRRLDESETDIEARSHALTSCRRILKALADTLYPPRKKPVTGSDGK